MVAESYQRVKAEHQGHHDDEAEIARRSPHRERQAALGTGQERVKSELAVALPRLAPYSADELGIAPVEPSGQGVAGCKNKVLEAHLIRNSSNFPPYKEPPRKAQRLCT